MQTSASTRPDPKTAALIGELRDVLSGEVRADALHRALYATDASVYQIVPDAVVFPRTVDDVMATVRACAAHGVPLTPRGAGTGLAGGAVNRGVQLDCSRHLNAIVRIEPDARTATVEPGVVLDELNAALAQHGLHFAPDVATSSRATLGGMIANNSCGAHSVLYGRTVDHVASVDVVLSDGSTCTWGCAAGDDAARTCVSDGGPTGRSRSHSPLADRCAGVLADCAREYADEIAARYPKILRRNGGYALDRLKLDGGRINPETIICGSEGTLAVVVGATLKLTPLPAHRGLIVVHFRDLLESLAATPVILEHGPAAVELIDKMVLDAARASPAVAAQRTHIEGDPQAVLIVELFDEDADTLSDRLRAVGEDLRRRGLGYVRAILIDLAAQQDIWNVRKSGLGLLMSRPGDRQPYAFVEDTAVDPTRLRDYIERFRAIVADEGVEQAGYYAHASVGCLHVRPVLNLSRREDVDRMRRIANRISSLALEFGGTMTGEHGDGIVRSCWLEKMYGPGIIGAFRRIKQTFDPHGIFNPGKIVDPMPMTDHLRYTFNARRHELASTTLDFTEHGGMAGLAGMCSGVGQCRQRLVGTMCPSYMATHDEMHTTRARANALRLALSDQGLLEDLDDPALTDVMDLCLSCKACKTECPTRVDMARLKAEWLFRRHQVHGVPLRSRLIAHVHELSAIASRVAPLANALGRSTLARGWMERLFGLDRRIPPPRLARRTFRDWFRAHRPIQSVSSPAAGGSMKGPFVRAPRPSDVVLFVDTWADYFTSDVGIAAVRVLEAIGYHVLVPPTGCCGRPAISKGLLDKARLLAERNVDVLADYAARGLPIIGLEPSCILMLVDEFPQLVRTPQARRIAKAAISIESFLARHLNNRAGPPGLVLRRGRPPVILPIVYHAHCHQKAMIGTRDAMSVLTAITGGHATEIDSGCCGMAGSFGHEREHYDIARAVGEQRLFPVVRSRGDAVVAVSGFSCRHQIEHHTGAAPRHVIEFVADALFGNDSPEV
ncbi:MAG: FAD-binding and (Fe-S)-binding domain-containing protein [Phycisphaerae bacterium]